MNDYQSTKTNNPLFLGIDLGTSSIKISLILLQETTTNIIQDENHKTQYKISGTYQLKVPSNQQQMQIISESADTAQQDPQLWWKYIKQGFYQLFSKLKEGTIFQGIASSKDIKGIGIAYQMHGLVLAKAVECLNQQENKNNTEIQSKRNCIIWCDGRTTQIGKKLRQKFIEEKIQDKLINFPGNFTISKLRWIVENQGHLISKEDQYVKFMLPGDFIAAKITNRFQTTPQGLSEGVLWDYQNGQQSKQALKLAEIPQKLLPEIVNNFTIQALSSSSFNQQFQLTESIPIYYRSGDQPNNAFSLNINQTGYAATTGGTSGVIYLVTDFLDLSPQKLQKLQKLEDNQPFNCFLHCKKDTAGKQLYGNLLCINGCGIAYKWIKKLYQFDIKGDKKLSYQQLNDMVKEQSSNGIIVLPFGNGPQRMLNNIEVGCQVLNVDYKSDLYPNIARATLQGIIFSFVYGFQILQSKLNNISIQELKAGHGNLFDSSVFSEGLASLLGVRIGIYKVNGSIGAAKGALEGWKQAQIKQGHTIQISTQPQLLKTYAPNQTIKEHLEPKYKNWKKALQNALITK